MNRILIVDDEEAVCWSLERAFRAEGHAVELAATAEVAFRLAAKHRPDTIFLDVRLPGMDGLSALHRLRQLSDDAPVIVITAFGNLATAVKAVEGGAFDYLAKPFDLEHAMSVVARALQRRASQAMPAPDPTPTPVPEDIVGTSPAIQGVFKRIALVAPRDSSVLITGESGTGKELVARALHRYSARRDRPFLPVHIAALNPGLVESELFGHVKGAFTGAAQARPGLLALADGGTVFFDELADIPLSVQVKLLRVLERGEMFAVGSSLPQSLNVRVFAATHQDLAQQVAAGKFRHDLYFRLNVFRIHLPPLRERGEDVAPLAEHFLRQLGDPGSLPLAPETVEYLKQQAWPGNVRELRNALEHAVIVARGGPLLPEHLPTPATIATTSLDPTQHLGDAVRRWLDNRIHVCAPNTPANLYLDLLRDVEQPLLEEVMRRLEGNRWAAAQWLGLNRATVRKKLALYGLADAARPGGDEEGET